MVKNKKLPKTALIIGIVVIAVVLAIFFLYRTIINNPQCQDRSYDQGWECRYPQIVLFMPQNKDLEYKIKCEDEGGTYNSMIVTKEMTTGGGVTMEKTGPFFYCKIPFSDYGNNCNSSDDCKGACEYVGEIPETCVSKDDKEYECPEEISGSCTDGVDDGYSGRKIVNGKLIYQTDFVIY